ncbi:efflux RND transporter periplasmic adaptor subunit [Paenibacillus sp. sptzw28]|uniref:efflux RND transporter periplasmic adaptor subunit n=1 Tax=Paenibacillus sp. sptzw28 TaxID=715179 RepID=UPI001C6EBB4D|nr:efflux RND transporter periplasmic adaptor subunit [Paenibacillus sp. sptzw28]QYR23010.1 efflux RND transporter periplasmic adaptor subunit [Paenibacillus sp. sptzw28]
MKKTYIWAAILTVAAVVTVNIWVTADQPSSSSTPAVVATVTVHKERMSDSILASGIVLPTAEEKIYRDGELGEYDLLVHEGQRVKQGTPLLRYHGEELERQLRDVVLSRKRLDLQLADNRGKVTELQQQFKNRIRTLSGDTDGSDTDAAVNQTAEELRALQQQIKVSEFEIKGLDEQRKTLEERRLSMLVKSRISGVVHRTITEDGLSGSESTAPILHIVSEPEYHIAGTITEFDAVLVQPGQTVTVKPKVQPDVKLKGVIRKIDYIPVESSTGADTAAQKDAVTSYPVVIDLVEPSDALKYGYHVFIEISLQLKGERLVVPYQAVRNENGQESVLLVEGGIVRTRHVVTGESNDSFVEIVEGLREGEQIVANPNTELKDGTAVQAEGAPS